jgi:hypothetical protein
MQRGADIWEASAYFGITPEIITRVYGHFSPNSGAGVTRALMKK